MSTIIATTLSNGSVSVPTATVVNGSAKAWVNFDGTGTIAARDSFNVASLTDNGTGNYTVNFSNAFASGNYSVGEGGALNSTSEIRHTNAQTRTTTAVQILCVDNNTSIFSDTAYASVMPHGDLA